MLSIIAIVVIVAIAVAAILLVVAAMKPDTFRVQRTIAVKAPPEKIFPWINDFAQWKAWSSYETRDPNMKRTFGATTAGKGATYEWEGNKNVGHGRMEIAESTPPSRIGIDLHFISPFENRCTAEFTIVPAGGDGTTVTWAMHGKQPFLGRVMCMFMNMDRMI